MQTTRIVQAVILMMVVAMAASCAASKEYTSKLFAPRIPVAKDTQAVAALRFLDIDSAGADKDRWVTTDIIMGRDTVSNTLALDKFSKVFPASPVTTDTAAKKPELKTTTTAVAVTKPLPVVNEPVAKNLDAGEVRTKRTRE